MNLVVRKLIAKEFHMNRAMIVGASVACIVACIVATYGSLGFNIGALCWLTTIIAAGVMLAIYGVLHERKENSLQFVLSLPLSPKEYVRAKLTGLLLSFLVPWLVATISAVALILLDPDIADGLLPYVLALCGFLLMNFALVLCGTMHARSESAVTVVIILTNMLVSVYMFTFGAAPGLRQHMEGATPVWNSTFFSILSIEFLIFILVLALPLATVARRRDFI